MAHLECANADVETMVAEGLGVGPDVVQRVIAATRAVKVRGGRGRQGKTQLHGQERSGVRRGRES